MSFLGEVLPLVIFWFSLGICFSSTIFSCALIWRNTRSSQDNEQKTICITIVYQGEDLREKTDKEQSPSRAL